MDPDDEQMLEMQLLQDQNNQDEYTPLLHLIQNRHLAAFKSLVKRALQRQPAGIDVNYRLPHPYIVSFLDKAASDNLPEFVEFLLEIGADPNIINPEFNMAPIHFAAQEGSAEALTALLRAPNIRPNLEAGRQTALHHAVKANSEACARLLIEAGASPNIPNSRGLTALHLAAELNSRDIVKLIVEGSKVNLSLDHYKDRKKETARDVIKKKFSDISLPEQSDNVDYPHLLLYYLDTNDETSFSSTLAQVRNLDELNNKVELLRGAVRRNLRGAMKELLARDSPPGELELLELGRIAVEQAHPEILKEILGRNPRLADQLVLTASQELIASVRVGPGNRNNRFECFRIILSKDDVEVRQEDDKGNSPLHYAARAECREAVELLLRKGAYIGHTNDFGSPPLAHLAPGILEAHMDDCLTSTNERTEEYEIVMDYRNLVPHNTECGETDDYFLRRRSSGKRKANPCSETEALVYIANHGHLKHLLKHPLLASFLYIKYLRIRHVLYFNFLFYLIFYVLLIWFTWAVTVDSPSVHQLDNKNKNSTNLTADSITNDEDLEGTFIRWHEHPYLSSLLILSTMYMVIREFLQLASSPLHYISSPENWLELTLIALTFCLLFGVDREVGAIAILISTWELVVLIAQHPRMSTNIEMFKRVTVNFAKFLLLYILLIIAFALSFYVLFRGDDNFPNPLGSLFKTIIMLTGELDSGELPFVSYPILSRLVFICFIFLIVIILLNLLNGLAVNDTGEILAEAELVCLISRARLVAYAERIAVGSPFIPTTRFCCFINYLPLQSCTTAPVRFIARRIQLFPRYLPHARLSVKPLKSFEITLHGRKNQSSSYSTLKMDSLVARRAKEILEAKGRESEQEKLASQMNAIQRQIDFMDRLLRNIAKAVNAANISENLSRISEE